MEWDKAKIDAAVCTLTEALGTTCYVEVMFREAGPRISSKDLFQIPHSRYMFVEKTYPKSVAICITPKEA